MNATLRLLILLVAWSAFGPPRVAWAQTTSLDFTNTGATNADDWKAHVALAFPGSLVTVSSNGYTSTVATAANNIFAVGNYTVGGNPVLPNRALTWIQINANNNSGTVPNNTATVTFFFSVPVANLTLRVSDIDKNVTGGSEFIDQVTFDGYNTTSATPNTAISLVGGNFSPAAGFNQFVSPNSLQGTNNSNATNAGTASVTFPSLVDKVTLTYKNLAPGANQSRQQFTGIESITFATNADVATTLATTQTAVQASASITYTATVQNNGLATATSVTPQVQLPAGLTAAAFTSLPAGATYNNNTGIVTLATVATLAPGAANALTYPITFTAPNYTTTITGQASSGATSPDGTAANNNGTAANANVQTVVSLVNNSCAGTVYTGAGTSGLFAQYYAGYYANNLGYFSSNTPTVTRTDGNLNFATNDSWGNIVPPATNNADDPNVYSSRYRGSIKITTAGTYSFTLTSDDASFMWLDGDALPATPTLGTATINNQNEHGAVAVTATVTLSAGPHNILVFYGENQGSNTLTLQYTGPDTGNNPVIVPNSVLCPTLVNVPPVAVAVTNTPAIPNTNGSTAISALNGTDQDGSVTNYRIVSIPTAAQGVLTINGVTPVTAGQIITAAQAAQLQFNPNVAFVGNATFTFQAQDNSNQLSNNTAIYTIPVSYGIAGTVFEDLNYGGGLGRSVTTANAVAAGSAVAVGTAGTPATAATVELYNSAGAFVATTQTSTVAGSLGQYTFSVATTGTYTVRVVNSSVRSTRTGSAAGLLPVQTYNGTTDRVGGEDPTRGDAAANSGTQTLTALTVATSGSTIGTIPQSQQSVTLTGTTGSTGSDFGFNFDVVANTNDSGQGSLRQFLTNAGTLGGEATLAQSGSRTNEVGTNVALASGKETSIFMIPGAAAVPGLRAGLTSGLTNGPTTGVALITTTSALTLSGANAANTIVDGGTQTFNLGNAAGNTAPGTVTGTSTTTVGVDGLAITALNVPEVEISGNNIATVLDVEAASATLRGFAIHGGNGANNNTVLIGNTASATGYLIENALVGVTAVGAQPGTNLTSTGFGIGIRANAGVGTVQKAFVAYTGNSGIHIDNNKNTVGTTQFLNNQFLQNGYGSGGGDGITFGDGGGSGPALVQGNLFTSASSSGLQFEIGSTSATQVLNNTITGAGLGGSALEKGGIVYLQRNGTNTGSQADVISKNVITNSQAAGIVVGYGQQNVTISQNQTSGNVGLGIDLIANSAYSVGSGNGYGNGDGVTVNDGNDPANAANTLPNKGVDFPVITQATLSGGTLTVIGFSRPGAVIEFFAGDNDATGFGEGQSYLLTRTEGNATDDSATGTGSYGPGAINGLSQGTDATASRFSFTIPFSSLTAAQQSALLANGLTATATLNTSTSEFAGRAPITTTVAGTIFDDVNYGGGLGRTYATANTSATSSGFAAAAIGSVGTTVELYNSAGAFVATTTTTTGGAYTFPAVAPGTYSVRVVNSTVKSVRNTAATGVAAVQTFRVNGGAADQARVGGESPAKQDAAANTGSQTLAALTAGTLTPESIATITVAATPAPITGVDFGFNFDAVVNTNNSGQGSLAQFITNANALPNTSLDQVAASSGGANPAAGIETSIFMIPNGAAHDGLTAYNAATNPGLISQLTGGVALIAPTTALPAITTANTSIDGTTQTQNVGDTNAATLGAGGNVGTANTALSTVNKPEVQITGTSAIAIGLDVATGGTGTNISGLAIYGFGNVIDNATDAEIRIAANNVTVNKSIVGTSATSFTDPGATTRSNADGIRVTAGTGSVFNNNLIGYNNGKGIATSGTAAITVTNNEIRSNALGSSSIDGIDIQGNNTTVTNNLFINNAGVGIDGYNTTGGNTITGNTVTGNGRGTATNGPNETAGVRIFGANNVVSQNVITNNYGAGILVEPGATTTRISQNSISGNGSVLAANNAAVTGDIGIDLMATADGVAAGTSPFVTLNSSTTGGANGLLNYPVLTSATLVGTNLVLKGYAKPGAAIELFLAQANAVGTPSTGNNFGQGQTYLTTLTEGSAADTDGRTGLSYSGNINGFNQGSDTNANGFIFTIALTAAQQAQVISGVKLTATSTLSNATSEFSGNISLSSDVTTTIAGPNTLAAGQTSGTFTATFSNAGNATAANVNQVVTLPAGASITPAQLTTIQTAYPGTTYAGGTLTFPQATSLMPGASNVYQFVFTAPSAAGTPSIVSTVSTATTQNPNTAPDVATFNLTVTSVADVVAQISGAAAAVPAGTSGTFTATFSNSGPSTAAGTQPTVQLPAGLNTGLTTGLVSASNGGSYDNTTGLITYPSTTSLTNGQSIVSTITYTQPGQGNVTATAAITTTTSQGALSSNGNPSTANDTQTATNTGSSGFDLATSLSGPASATAGTQVTYAVTTTNGGPGAAPTAVQTVSLVTAAALENVFLTNGGTYSFSSGTSLFTFPTIPALGSGQQVNNSISFTSPGPGAGSLALTALATPNTTTAGDANTANNQTSIVTNLTAAPAAAGNTANVYVTIASDAPTGGVAPGAPVTFTVKQGNNGPNAATAVTTRVYLPAGLAGVQIGGNNPSSTTGTVATYPGGATYDSSNGVVTFPAQASEGSSFTPLSYTVKVNAPASGVITATANVSTGTNDPVPADNVALTSVTVNQAIYGDVTTTLNGPSTATPGESIVYTVSAINNGTTAATGVTQTVQLPANLAGVVVRDANNNIITNSTTSGYNAATGLVVFSSVATLGSGASLTRTITLPAPDNAASATGGTIVPVASVSSSSFDNVLTNNSASVTTKIVPTTDFVVALSGPATSVVGNPVTFTVSTTNNGASVGGQQTTVQLPTGLDAAGGGLVLPTGATYNGTTGILTLAAVTAQGLGTANAQTAAVTFNVPAGTVLLTPTAQVTPASGTNDANLGNNAATATTTVTPATETVINLATTVTSNAPGNTAGAGGTQTAGLPITFTVTASNLTASTSATNVVQQLSLAAGLTGVVIDGNNPSSTTNGVATYPGGTTYNANTGVVTFPAITLAGTASSHTVLVNAPGTGPLVAVAAVKGDQTDVAQANNTATTSITITQSADLVTSTTGPTTTNPGTPVSYSVVTTNNGATAAVGVVPTMTLPAGATNVVLPAGATQAGSVVTFATVGNLAAGQSATNTVTFTTPATASFTVSSTSTTTTNEPNTGNNPSSLTTANPAQTAAPVAFSVVSNTVYSATNGTVNSPSANTAAQNFISPLASAASTGQSIATYTVSTIPTAAQGILYYNNNADGVSGTFVAVAVGQTLTPAQAAKLKFDPADNATTTASVGDISFTYTATDNVGKVSNTAIYTIPVGRDNNSVYTATPNKGGFTQYQTNDVLAFVIDPNGAAYNGSGLVYNPAGTTATILAAGGNNGLVNQAGSVVQAPSGSGPAASGLYPANPTNALPAGVALNTTTGLIYVVDRNLLVRNTSVKYYQINVTTTDIYGGTNVVTAQFSIGAYPLPVELTDFTASAVKNVDAALVWHTASEKNNDRFEVERSLNGTDFVKIGEVAGQGTKSSPTAYALTDAGIGAKAMTVYYRLQQVDADGTSTYSPVRTVAFAKAVTPGIALYPNPATSATQLDLSQLPAGSYQVSVLDATGRVVLSATQEAGLAQALDLTTIASGTYVVLVRGQVNGQALTLTKRLIKE